MKLALAVALLALPAASAVTYPDYCSKISDSSFSSKPRIPPLSSPTSATLLSASAIIRHGARTPYAGGFYCWPGYASDPAQSVFDCDTSMVMTTAPTSASVFTSDSNLLFKKNYDGLVKPLKNALGGTCHVGQLIAEGVMQETRNGEGLRERFVCDDDKDCLFPTAGAFLKSPGSNSLGIDMDDVYFRGDDQQRTLMSGQLLTEALFPTTEEMTGEENVLVEWHTADYKYDPIYPNANICPRLTELETEAFNSPGFVTGNSSRPDLDALLEETFAGADWRHSVDCQMTAKCNDRHLPKELQDTTTFDDVYEHASWKLAYVYQHNDNSYGKLSMAPLLADVLGNSLKPSLASKTKKEVTDNGGKVLSVYSGHDTTVMPVLAALGVWDGAWAPYASMIVVETYYVDADERAFRLVYNGDVLTSKVGGCVEGEELCKLETLTNYLETFAVYDRDCDARGTHGGGGAVGVEGGGGEGAMSTGGWLLVLMCSCVVVSVGTAFTMERKYNSQAQFSQLGGQRGEDGEL